jgi:DNA-binding PucR family transcriptional regulator
VVLTRARSARDDSTGAAAAQQVLGALRRRIVVAAQARAATAAPRAVAAIGDPQARLKDAYLSYRQARLAAKVAAVIPAPGDVARWRDLGVFRTLVQLPEPAGESALDPRVTAPFAAGDPDLAGTLETYLDLGCDVKAASARLHVHRATLYYRLDKVQRLAGVNLRDGNDRLAVHLSFKLARLTGLHPYGGRDHQGASGN